MPGRWELVHVPLLGVVGPMNEFCTNPMFYYGFRLEVLSEREHPAAGCFG